jgi:hypothetical protein
MTCRRRRWNRSSIHPLEFAGETPRDKTAGSPMPSDEGADAVVLTDPASICWLSTFVARMSPIRRWLWHSPSCRSTANPRFSSTSASCR